MAFPSALRRKFGASGRRSEERLKSMPMDKPSRETRGAPMGKCCESDAMRSRHDMTDVASGDFAARRGNRYKKGA